MEIKEELGSSVHLVGARPRHAASAQPDACYAPHACRTRAARLRRAVPAEDHHAARPALLQRGASSGEALEEGSPRGEKPTSPLLAQGCPRSDAGATSAGGGAGDHTTAMGSGAETAGGAAHVALSPRRLGYGRTALRVSSEQPASMAERRA